jgi:L-seryl-tRNA(Ser) seleniumtransferase
MNDRSEIPSVEKLLQTDRAIELISQFGRPLVLSEIRNELETIRKEISKKNAIPDSEKILTLVNDRLDAFNTSSIQPVINATGVILHTNLGRAPLSKSSLEAIENGLQGYSSLEYDLSGGERNQRSNHTEWLLQKLLGVESALIVNNNAAAVLLILSALAYKKRVIIPLGQLVEIGGGFRVPDVMRQSGAKLVEIGTTNRVHISDFESALIEQAGLVLHVHSSNFKVIGFTSEPSLDEIVKISHIAGVPVLDDLGSGALMDTGRFGLAHEPTVQESLAAGVDVVCFSGDKLLGGPQAGIIVGRNQYLDRIKKHPLTRAVRADKTLLLGLEATLLHYLKDEAVSQVPVWKMIAYPLDDLLERVEFWKSRLKIGEILKSQSTVGGGSLPEETLPTWVLAIKVNKPDKLVSHLRSQTPAVIARIQEEKVVLDPRTIFPEQDEILITLIRKTLDWYREKYEN